MLNQVILVGRLTRDLELVESENGKQAVIELAVGRNFKNKDGEYENDFITCILWNAIAENTAEYCKKGDIVGVKGRLQTEVLEKEDGTKVTLTRVIAEKVTFLSSKKPDEEEC